MEPPIHVVGGQFILYNFRARDPPSFLLASVVRVLFFALYMA